MHIVSLVCGILGLLLLPLMVVAHSPLPLFAAVTLALIAVVTGVLSRAQRAGMAGLILGAIGSLGTMAFVFLFMARSTSSVSAPVVHSEPATLAPR